MSSFEPQPKRARGQAGVLADTPLEARRYLTAISRNRWLIAVIMVIMTGIVIVVSLSIEKKYTATATIVLDSDTTVLGPPDPVTVQRDLATANSLLTSTRVLTEAANQLGNETADSIDSAISSAVDPDANLITVSATSPSPPQAAAIANSVAKKFLGVQAMLKRQRFDEAAAQLREQLRTLQDSSTSSDAEIAALQQRISDLQIEQASVGSELALAEAAIPPTSPSSPKPFRNAILAIFASAFLGVLITLGREQLKPGVSEPRELGRLFGLPVLISIPMVRRPLFERGRHRSSALEGQLYQTLASSLQLTLPEADCSLLTITSSIQGEGKTTVASRLGVGLAQAGHDTLVISADLRAGALHTALGIPQEPGLSDLLAFVKRSGVSEALLPAIAHDVPIAVDQTDRLADAPGVLHALSSGSKVSDPANLLSRELLTTFFDYVRGAGYRYVIVDAPPLLGVAEAQPLVTLADQMILVARPERLSQDNVIVAEDLLSRLDVSSLGLVVIGGGSDTSLYYYGGPQRPNILSNPRIRGRSRERT